MRFSELAGKRLYLSMRGPFGDYQRERFGDRYRVGYNPLFDNT